MFHHSSKDYHQAASEAAKKGREKMETIIANGRANAEAVLHQVQSQVPKDLLSIATALKVVPQGNRYGLAIRGAEPMALHENAFRQVAEKAGVPNKYLDDLRSTHVEEGADPWAQELVAYNLNELMAHRNSRHLIRSVEGEVRGFLSDQFRRIDSRPMVDSFMGACMKIGAVPIDGYALDTRVRMRAVLPYVFEPMPNEVMLFGLEWGNSDFGHGGHKVSLFNTRVWCTNTAVLDEVLRQVHLGKRLEDNILYSQKTYELDNKANASALADIVNNSLSAEKVNGYLDCIRKAVEQKIDEKDVTRILKAKLGKGDAEKVKDLFDSPDVVNLPPGNSIYRLSNAVSFFSQGKDISRQKQLDLQRIAGELIPVTQGKAKEI
jgi:hypothetical protein